MRLDRDECTVFIYIPRLQGDHHLPDSAPDEPFQGGTELDVLRVRRDDQEEEIIDDERVPTSLYLSASRSQSRSLLRAESIRVSILANILSGEHGVPDGYIYSF